MQRDCDPASHRICLGYKRRHASTRSVLRDRVDRGVVGWSVDRMRGVLRRFRFRPGSADVASYHDPYHDTVLIACTLHRGSRCAPRQTTLPKTTGTLPRMRMQEGRRYDGAMPRLRMVTKINPPGDLSTLWLRSARRLFHRLPRMRLATGSCAVECCEGPAGR